MTISAVNITRATESVIESATLQCPARRSNHYHLVYLMKDVTVAHKFCTCGSLVLLETSGRS